MTEEMKNVKAMWRRAEEQYISSPQVWDRLSAFLEWAKLTNEYKVTDAWHRFCEFVSHHNE